MDCHECFVGNTKKIVGSTPEPSLIKGLIVKLDAKDYTVEESGYCHLAG